MKKNIIVIVAIVFVGVVFLVVRKSAQESNFLVPSVTAPVNTSPVENQSISQVAPPDSTPAVDQISPDSQNSNGFQSPLDRAAERVTKKPFGIYITPKTSPVQPERFQGYHTGTDFEIFPEELNSDVPVSAICAGKIVSKRTASGYGGVLVQDCKLDNQPVTVIYGHLKLASISKNVGEDLNAGEEIGILGKAYSSETDGERKHFHLGIHKGNSISILGYVSAKSNLSGWIDPCLYTCK